MKLSIIIVSWNTCKLTLKCLKSVFKCLDLGDFSRHTAGSASGGEVFLVDNNSNDGTVESVTQTFKSDNLHIITNQANVGFARANNQALRFILRRTPTSCRGTTKDPIEKDKNHFILLLNPDTELIDDSFQKIIDFMEQHPDCGILGPKLLNSDLTLQKSCRKFPRLINQLFIQLKFYNFFPEKIKWVRGYYMLDFDHNEIREVDQVMGAAMLIRREVFSKIGLLDENFWSVFEEVDFCKRAKDAGFKICFYPETQIIHHKAQSFEQMSSLKKQINFNQSLYHYFKKHKPLWQLIILWLVQPINLFLTFIDEVIGIRKFFGKRKDL